MFLIGTHFAKQNISNLHSKYIETEGYIEFLQSKNISTHAVCLIRCFDVYDEETKQTVDIKKEFYYIVGDDDSTEISVN